MTDVDEEIDRQFSDPEIAGQVKALVRRERALALSTAAEALTASNGQPTRASRRLARWSRAVAEGRA